jgi:hypothetical protein
MPIYANVVKQITRSKDAVKQTLTQKIKEVYQNALKKALGKRSFK